MNATTSAVAPARVRSLTPFPSRSSDEKDGNAVVAGRNGRPLRPFMGFPFYQNISEADLDAIVG
jgi:hypothetical protein